MTPVKNILWLLVLLAVVRGIIYASFIPPWQAPDEPAHFERARSSLSTSDWTNTSLNQQPDWYNDLSATLFKAHFWDFVAVGRPALQELPLTDYIDLYHQAYGGVYSSRLAYFGMGWPLVLFSSQDIFLQLYVLRLYSVILSVGTILLAYLLTRTIFPNETFLVLGVPVLILFNPQHTHIFASINNGNMAELFTTAVLLLLVTGIMHGFSKKIGAAILLLTLAAMWTKATAYFLVFVILIVALFYLWQYRRYWYWLIPAGLVLVALIYLFMPTRFYLLLNEFQHRITAGQIYLNPVVPRVMFGSFWALPGWLTLQLDRFWYMLLAVFVVLSGVGLAILAIKKWRHVLLWQPKTRALALLAMVIVLVIAIPLFWSAITGTDTYRQGRSLYPAIVPISLFLMLGWRQLIPAGWRNFGLFALTALLFLFDTMVLFTYIIPFFYSRL